MCELMMLWSLLFLTKLEDTEVVMMILSICVKNNDKEFEGRKNRLET